VTLEEIDGLPGKWLRVQDHKHGRPYNVCTVCGGLGWAWNGWFTCDAATSGLGHVATIPDGDVYVRVV
jgi:hypothetical protein